MSSSAAKKTTRSSASASASTARRRRHTADGSGHPARSTRSSAKRKRTDDDDADNGSVGRGTGSGDDGNSQRRQRKRQKRSSSPTTSSNATSSSAAAAAKKKRRKKEKKPQDADDNGDEHDTGTCITGGELKVGTTLTFGGGDQTLNDENVSGNAHNLSLVVTVVGTLGSGAHGTVFLAETAEEEEEDGKTKTKYVLKVPMDTKDDVKEARNEIRALGALKGVPGVVQMVASSNVGGTGVCLLLKHVDGQVLEEYIEERGCLSLRETWHLMKQLVATLVEMKKAGLSHLDIKPDNCLVTTKDRRLVLFDFGTARPCGRLTSDDLGTVFFDAPEICRGDKKKAAARKSFDPLPADMYSVARTFLVALVGYHPRSNSTAKTGGGEEDWWEEDAFGTIDGHIGSIRERCPAAADLLGQLLHEDPTQRPTAEQALEALTERPWD